MDKNIKQILTELYELEPSLQQHEAKLIKVVQKLLATKPNTRFDKAFAKQLRAQLLAGQSSTKPNSFNFNFMQKFGYLIGGAVVASILFVPALLFDLKNNSSVPSLVADREITLVGEQAFGQIGEGLALAPGLGASETTSFDSKISAVAPNIARPQSGGGGTSASLIYDPNGPYTVTQFDYNYVGESFDLESDKLEVLRQVSARPGAANLLSSLSLGLVNLNSVSGLKLENVSLSQGTSDGIRVYTDFTNGEIFINQESGFAIQEIAYKPLTPSEVPADEELIEIANNFIKKFGIKLEGYSNPEVSAQNRYAIELYASQGPDIAYIPDIFTVVYPLVVRDLPVYDQGGNKVGIQVSINVRNKQAVSISGITSQKYEASLYPVNSDIAAMLEKYESQYRFAYDGNYVIDNVEVKLGTPELVFATMATYTNNQFNKLLVPAYRFPVLEKPEGNPWFSDSIVILLVSGLDGQDGPVRIMPLETKSSPGVVEPAVQPVQ